MIDTTDIDMNKTIIHEDTLRYMDLKWMVEEETTHQNIFANKELFEKTKTR